MNFRIWFRNNIFTTAKRGTAPAEIRRYIARNSSRKLNIGSGGNRLPGWLNVDRFPPPSTTFMDVTKRLPFPDKTLDVVLCEHMIEHVPKSDALRLLSEIRRMLVPGGLVRIVTPDLDWLSKRIVEPVRPGEPDDAYRAFLAKWQGVEHVSWCDAINLCFYEHGHCYIWSIEELSRAMRDAGFTDLSITRAGEPENPVFNDVEGHAKLIGGLVNSLEAFAIEARA